MNNAAYYLPLLISLLCLSICVFTFIYLRSYMKRRTHLDYLKNTVISEITVEVNQLLKDIDETTERDVSLIEERQKRLRNLLDDIDKRLDVYIREMDMRKEAGEAYSSLVSTAVSSEEAYKALGKNRHKRPPAISLPEFSVKSDEEEVKPSIQEQIKELLMAGFSAPIIASRLGISIAEAEFAAALYNGALNENPITGS